MGTCDWIPLICCFAVVGGGCTSAKKTPARIAKSVRGEDLVGQWRFARVGGEAPAHLETPIKSQEVEGAADGPGIWRRWCGVGRGLGLGQFVIAEGSPAPAPRRLVVARE